VKKSDLKAEAENRIAEAGRSTSKTPDGFRQGLFQYPEEPHGV